MTGACVLCLINKGDTHHYEKHFLPFLHWIRCTPGAGGLLHLHASCQHPEVLELGNGLHAVEMEGGGHGSRGYDFEQKIIDHLLRFMEESRRQRNLSS